MNIDIDVINQKKLKNIKIARAVLQVLSGFAIEIATGFFAELLNELKGIYIWLPLTVFAVLTAIVAVIYFRKMSIPKYDNDYPHWSLGLFVFVFANLLNNLIAEIAKLERIFGDNTGLQIAVAAVLAVVGGVMFCIDFWLDERQDVYEEAMGEKLIIDIEKETEIDFVDRARKAKIKAVLIALAVSAAFIALAVCYFVLV